MEFYAVMEWLGDGFTSVTMIEKPEGMNGIWIVDWSDGAVLYVLPDEGCLQNLQAHTMVVSVWMVVRDMRSRRN